jgi:hypothetical protein
MDTFEASHSHPHETGSSGTPFGETGSRGRLAPLQALVVMVASSAALWLALIGGAWLAF